MQRNRIWLSVVVVAIVALGLAGCGQKPAAAVVEDPVKVFHTDNADISQVVLTKDAAKRIDIQTASVASVDDEGIQRLVIPYSAVLYDLNGETWAYTNPGPLSYLRQSIDVESIDGDRALLAAGPPEGTQVVTVGVTELFGAEFAFAEP